MRLLQDLFDKQLQEQIQLSIFLADVIEDELLKRGLHLTSEQKNHLIDELDKNKDNLSDNFSFQINDDGTVQITKKSSEIDLVLDLIEGAEAKVNAIIDNLPKSINDLTDSESEILLQNIKKRASIVSRREKKDQKDFIKQLNQKWGKVLDQLEVFVTFSEELGADFANEIIQAHKEDESPRFTILNHSLARGCQVSKEIITLLRNGFADGAHARWRTLHEIAVETNIINKNDNDLAKKYIDHDLVRKLNTAKAFSKYDKEFGDKNVTKNEIENLENACKELEKLYGKDFLNENGWAVS